MGSLWLLEYRPARYLRQALLALDGGQHSLILGTANPDKIEATNGKETKVSIRSKGISVENWGRQIDCRLSYGPSHLFAGR